VLRGLFVTGTDTGVGKTVVSAALMHRYRRDVALRYWKPVQTGIEQDDDTREVAALGACEPDEVCTEGIRLPRPVSPHLAARLHGTTIEVGSLAAASERETAARAWIVEGAGGVLVPLNRDQIMADLIVMLGLPAVVAARSSLGTINHTLLTLEALRNRGITVGGVVMVGDPNGDNRDAIERYGNVRVVGEMPRFDPLEPQTLRAWAVAMLDTDARLLEHLR